MTVPLEEVLLSVWHQALVEGLKTIKIADDSYPVCTTSRRKLKQIDFRLDGSDIRALEQNPDTKSRWAALARKGKPVMQFLENDRYIAVVADGKFFAYGAKLDGPEG